MMQIMYFIPLVAWIAFVYHQYHTGDRPVTYLWFAIMAGLGTFECAKGLFGLVGGMPATEMALGAGIFAAACVLVARARAQMQVEGDEIPQDVAHAQGR
jgi:hypothetical protein